LSRERGVASSGKNLEKEMEFALEEDDARKRKINPRRVEGKHIIPIKGILAIQVSVWEQSSEKGYI